MPACRLCPHGLCSIVDGVFRRPTKTCSVRSAVDTRTEGFKDVPVRWYTPETASSQELPVIVYFHGGGWVAGKLMHALIQKHMHLQKVLVTDAQHVHVIFVSSRLLDDAVACHCGQITLHIGLPLNAGAPIMTLKGVHISLLFFLM